jgi:hypothetical protein
MAKLKLNKEDEATVTTLQPTEETPELINMKRKVELINKGFIVHITSVENFKEENNYLVLKVTLTSEVNRMMVFGNVEMKITKQALPRLKTELARVR